MKDAFIICPKCKRKSWHPEDIAHEYCTACGFHDGRDPKTPPFNATKLPRTPIAWD